MKEIANNLKQHLDSIKNTPFKEYVITCTTKHIKLSTTPAKIPSYELKMVLLHYCKENNLLFVPCAYCIIIEKP